MNGIWLMAKRELQAYLNSMWGYVVVAAILLLDGILFNAYAVGDVPKYSSDVLEGFFYFSFGTTAVAAVFLTMRLLAEERQTGTITLIDSSPLADWQVVAGKYASALIVLTVLLVASLYMPALIFVNGKVSLGHIFAGYLGLFLVGAACTAIGTFASAIARSQLVAAVIAAAGVMFLLTTWLLARISDPPIKDVLAYTSLFDKHFRGFMTGRISIEDGVYFLSVAFVFLMLSTRWLSARRWQ